MLHNLGCIISCNLMAAPNPASQACVLAQLAMVNIATINNQASVQFYYNINPNSGTANPPDPIYLICVGVNASDGYTPVSIAGAITAV